MRNMKMALCEGRHEIPEATDGAIFPAVIEDPTDLEAMMKVVNGKLRYCARLDLYVTGLTVALVTVVNYAICNNMPLTLYHYDSKSGKYYAQPVETDRWYGDLVESGVVGKRACAQETYMGGVIDGR